MQEDVTKGDWALIDTSPEEDTHYHRRSKASVAEKPDELVKNRKSPAKIPRFIISTNCKASSFLNCIVSFDVLYSFLLQLF